jgi:hypothetical protein
MEIASPSAFNLLNWRLDLAPGIFFQKQPQQLIMSNTVFGHSKPRLSNEPSIVL